MSRWPKVSVVISTYKRPALLREALRSVLDQTFRDFEVIVVEDGARDAISVVEEFDAWCTAAGIPLRYVATPENSGYQAMPKNVGITLAHGSYIAYCDDDDLWLPHHLDVLVKEIEKGECEFVYSRFRIKREGEFEGGPPDGMEFPFTPFNIFQLGAGPQFNFIPSHTLHSKAAVLRAHGSKVWNEEIDRFGDWELYLRSANYGLRFRGVDSVTFVYRWHGTNLQLTRAPGDTRRATMAKDSAKRVRWRGVQGVHRS